tara:strand:+ start:701 stop:1276 length:576 start_codon:yes stop_codon:yes gene_type:complete
MVSTRRSLLKKGLVGGGLLAVSGVGLSLQPGQDIPVPPQGLKILTPQNYATLMAIIPHVLPVSKGFPSTGDIQVAQRVDDLLALLHPADGAELAQALQVIENPVLGLVLDGRFRPFSVSSATEQEQTLRNWKTSRLAVRRTGYVALTGLIKSCYFSHPKTYAAVGYPGPPDYSKVASPGQLPDEPGTEATP